MKREGFIAYLKGREEAAAQETERLTKEQDYEGAKYFKGRADAFLTIANFVKNGYKEPKEVTT